MLTQKIPVELRKFAGPASLASELAAEKYGSKLLGRLSLGIGLYFLAQDVDYYSDAYLQNQIIENHE